MLQRDESNSKDRKLQRKQWPMEELKFQSLSSKRLILRKPMLDDAKEIFDLRSNEQVNQYLDRQAATSIEDAVTFIEKILAIINRNEGCYWAICLKENPRPVGTICYFDFSSDQTLRKLGTNFIHSISIRALCRKPSPRFFITDSRCCS